MKRWALIQGGTVSTLTESDTQPDTFGGPWVEAPGHVGPGWTWDGSEWAAPDSIIPTTVTMRQARLALLGAGLLDTIPAAIAAIPDATERRAAEIVWEYSTEVQRHNGLVSNLAPALGLTDADIDALFVAASQL